MREAVVVASSRTPLAKSFRGSFNLTRPDELAAHCIRNVLGKAPQLDPSEIEDVILGCGQPHGSQGHNIARVSAIRAGLPASIPGTTVNRFCSSGLQAIAMAAHHVMNDGAEAAIGGGVESITMLQRDSSPNPWVKEHKPGVYMVMGDTAEVVAKRYKISREAQDQYSLLSQQRTARAQQEGFFKEELAPMQVERGILDKKTGEVVGKEQHYVDGDECNRADTTLEGLLKLPPHFDKDSGQGSVTAGNSSQLSDGASATLIMSRERADKLGIQPKLVFRGFAVSGCEPDEMGIGPVFAVPRLLERTGVAALHLEDQVAPKKCGHIAGKQVIPTAEFCDKIRAASEYRTDPDFVIIARTDARAVTGLEDAIERSNRYAEAGADVIFFEAPQTVEEIERVARHVKAPLLANMVQGGRTPSVKISELQRLGFKIVIFPAVCMAAAVQAMERALVHLREKETDWHDGPVLGPMDIFKRVGFDWWHAVEQKFARP